MVATLLTATMALAFFPIQFNTHPSNGCWWMGTAGAFGFIGSLVVHELGRSLAARALNVPTRRVTLFVFGGVPEIGSEPPTPRAEFVSALGGLSASAVLSVMFFSVAAWAGGAHGSAEVAAVLSYLGWLNLIVLVFNLMPALPLDGGRVLRSALWARKHSLRLATRFSANSGAFFGVVMICWGIVLCVIGCLLPGTWHILIGWSIRRGAQISYQQMQLNELLAGQPVRRFMNAEPVTLPASTSVKAAVENCRFGDSRSIFPVVHRGQLLGCVTFEQMNLIPQEEWEHCTVGAVTAPCSSDNTIETEIDAREALWTMSRNRASGLMVVQHGDLVGMVAWRDIVKFLSKQLELQSR